MKRQVANVEWRVEIAEKNMKREITVLALGAWLFALSFSAQAQQPPKLAKIGWLFGGIAASMASQRDEIVKLLHDLGYIESKNIAFEYRYADNELDRLPALAHELISLKIDVLLARAPRTALAAKNATKTIPIVFYMT